MNADRSALAQRVFPPARAFAALPPELLRRYDGIGPRYTSYPTSPQFREDFGEPQLQEAIRRSQDGSEARPLSLYAHVPFCENPCFYCGCSRVISRNPEVGVHYVTDLIREATLWAPLFTPGRQVVQLHLGGGTPNFLAAADLKRLLAALSRLFTLSTQDSRDYSIELDPRHVQDGDLAALLGMGFNRMSFGIQDFDPAVQRAINRVQDTARIVTLLKQCRSEGVRSVNVDLIYGLPYQTLAGFERTLETVLEARPSRFAVYGYAHLPKQFKAQRQIPEESLPDRELRIQLLELAIERLGAAGYRYIGMDHFALPEDELALAQQHGSLHRNFMGYTTHADCDLIGMGASAISHVADTYSQNVRDVAGWREALDRLSLPVFRGLRLSADDQVRAQVIQALMCHGRVDTARVEREHDIQFDAYFAAALHDLTPLIADGLAVRTAQSIEVTTAGRYLIRSVARCFDRYHTAGSVGSKLS